MRMVEEENDLVPFFYKLFEKFQNYKKNNLVRLVQKQSTSFIWI